MATYDNEHIIRYVEEELSAEEKQQFEADLQESPSLAAEVALYKELKEVLQQRLPPDEMGAALRNTLRGLNPQYFGTGAAAASSTPATTPSGPAIVPSTPDAPIRLIAKPRRIPVTRWLAGIAAAASVIIATLFLWPSGKNDYLDRLGRTEMISTTERGGNADSLLQQAAVYFNRQEFDKAPASSG